MISGIEMGDILLERYQVATFKVLVAGDPPERSAQASLLQ